MATISDRLATLEAAVASLAGGVVSTTVITDTASAQDAQQNTRLATIEATAQTLSASLASLSAQQTELENADLVLGADVTDLRVRLADAERRILVLEGKPGGSTDYVRAISDGVGSLAESIGVEGGTSPSSYSEIILATDGLVGYWRLGEASGTTADNAEGTAAIDGEYINTPTLGVTGAIAGDTAITLTAANSERLRIPDDALLDLGNGPLSYELWIKCSSAELSSNAWLMAKGTHSPALYRMATTGILAWRSYGWSTGCQSTVGITDTDWHYIVGTKSTGNVWTLYLDGADVTSAVGSSDTVSTSADLLVGCSSDLDEFFDGSLDEVAVYSRELTAEEVAGHYAGTYVPPPPPGSVTVATIPALLDALANDSVTDIIVTNGTYVVPGAYEANAATALWIGSRYAGRTNAVTVRAETTGGVTFSGGGASNWCGARFVQGAHHQTWRGFNFTNADLETSVVGFGGYPTYAPPHDITLEDIEVSGMIGTDTGHAIYFSYANAPITNIVVDNFNVTDTSGSIIYAFHFYHDYRQGGDEAGTYNCQNVTIRNCAVVGCDYGFAIWAGTLNNILIENCTVTNARERAVRYERGSNIVFDTVTSTGSNGFSPTYYIPGGPYNYPTIPEYNGAALTGQYVTFTACSWG